MKSICLITSSFGRLSNYFGLFLESCRRNPTVNWIVFTDCDDNENWPSNVRKAVTSFEDYKKRFASHFDFDIALDRPYKLCDFKPAYGEVLADELSGFDFWGHCDCDLIFGNIRHFLTDEILSQHIKLFSRGHLSIYRNDPETNSYYRRQTYFPIETIYTDPKVYSFDEWGGLRVAWEKDRLPIYDELIMDDIAKDYDGFHPTKQFSGRYSPYSAAQTDLSREYRKMKHILYSFRDGNLIRFWLENGDVKSEPVLYAHFQKRAMAISPELSLVRAGKEGFLIANNTFLPYSNTLNASNIKNLTGSSFSFKNFYLNTRKAVYSFYADIRK